MKYYIFKFWLKYSFNDPMKLFWPVSGFGSFLCWALVTSHPSPYFYREYHYTFKMLKVYSINICTSLWISFKANRYS